MNFSIYKLQVLAPDMYKTSDGLSTPLMKDISLINKNPYILKHKFLSFLDLE